MASKRRNMFYENKKQETTEVEIRPLHGTPLFYRPVDHETEEVLETVHIHGVGQRVRQADCGMMEGDTQPEDVVGRGWVTPNGEKKTRMTVRAARKAAKKYLREITWPTPEEPENSEEERKEVEYFQSGVYEVISTQFKKTCGLLKRPVPHKDLPGHKSVYTIMKENMRMDGMRHHVHRLTMIFRYNDKPGDPIQEAFELLVSTVNEDRYRERIAGTMLYYDKVGFLLIEDPDIPDIPYCGGRRLQCCSGRQDHCSVQILGTLCYCDAFCNRTINSDCCPDYPQVCLGEPPEQDFRRGNKLTIYSMILKPTWTCGIELWGSARKSNIDRSQSFQSKTLDAP
ncbi:hypothetical protein AAG570_007164 [Ranatra chinensis]|uniref:SMB domain-containing protein n=1 Tax=Ranatra chinensis TaxID=642074 RepID=A0ABD0XVD5_9HEMI